MTEIKREPAGNYRTAAAAMRQMFLALVDEGFKPAEALVVIGHLMAVRPETP